MFHGPLCGNILDMFMDKSNICRSKCYPIIRELILTKSLTMRQINENEGEEKKSFELQGIIER